MGETAPDRWDKDSKKYDRDKITMDWVLKNMQTELENTNKDLRKAEEETIKNDILNQLTPLRRTIQADNKDNIRTLWNGFYLRQKKGATDFLKTIDSNQEWQNKRALCIIAVQTLLEDKRYFDKYLGENITSRDRIDGIYKEKTHEAVLKFQKDYNNHVKESNAKDSNSTLTLIKEDGFIGIQTIKALVTDLGANNQERTDSNPKESNLQQKMLKDILDEIGNISPGEANGRLYKISKYDEATLHKEYSFGFDAMKKILEALCGKAHIGYDDYLNTYPNLKKYMDNLKKQKGSELPTTLDDRIKAIDNLDKNGAIALLETINGSNAETIKKDYPFGFDDMKTFLENLCKKAELTYEDCLKKYPNIKTYLESLQNQKQKEGDPTGKKRMTPKELDDFIAELKQLNEKGAREKLFIIADYNQQMLEDTYSAIELKKVLETLCPIAGKGFEYDKYLDNYPVIKAYIQGDADNDFSEDGEDKKGVKVEDIKDLTINNLDQTEAQEILNNLNTKLPLSQVRTNLPKIQLQSLCKQAGVDYNTRINDPQHQHLKDHLDMLELISTATSNEGGQELTNNNKFNKALQTSLQDVYFQIEKPFDSQKQYPYSVIKYIKSNTIGIDNAYKEDQNDPEWEKFRTINEPRRVWLEAYKLHWETIVKALNGRDKSLREYIAVFNQACHAAKYQNNGKHLDDISSNYFDNKNFVLKYIKDKDTHSQKSLTTADKRLLISKILKGQEIDGKKVSLKGSASTRNTLKNGLSEMDSIFSQSPKIDQQWIRIAGELIEEHDPIDLNTILRGSSDKPDK